MDTGDASPRALLIPGRPPPEPGSTSDAGWFHDLVLRIAAARNAGDTAEVNRLRDYARREGDAGLAQLVEQLLSAVDEASAAAKSGRPMTRRSVGANLPGQRICDFCASPTTVAYYPFDEFELLGPNGTFSAGDRMYVCLRCHQLVEAGDWKGLRRLGRSLRPGHRHPDAVERVPAEPHRLGGILHPRQRPRARTRPDMTDLPPAARPARTISCCVFTAPPAYITCLIAGLTKRGDRAATAI